MRASFDREGAVRGTDVLAGLVALWREGASGSLQFSRSGATTGFEIADGEIIGTQSSDPRFETASILLRAGKLDDATVGRLAVPEGGDRALLALQAGVLTRREWRWGEKIRAVELLADLLTWLEGEYWLLRTPGRTPGEFRLPIPRLILELFLRSRDRSLVLHHLGGVDHPLSRAERFETEFPTFGLTADAESVVRLIDGKSTAAEIASEAPADAFAVEKLLAALVTLGLVRPEFAADAASPPRRVADAELEEGPEAVDEEAVLEGAGEEEQRAEVEEDTGERTEGVEAAPEEAAGTEEEEAGDEEPEIEVGGEEPTAEPAAEIEEVVLDEPERPASVPASGGLPPGPSAPEQEAALEAAVQDAALDGSIREDALERARMRFEPESEMAGAASEDLEPAREASDLGVPLTMTVGPEGDRARPRRSKSTASLVVLLVLLAAGVAAVLLLRRGEPGGLVPSAVVTPVSSPSAEASPAAAAAVVATPGAAVSSPAPTGREAAPPPTSRPAPATKPTARAARRGRGEGSRSYWLDRAARDQKRTAADRQARFAIQLELACEVPSLVEAWRHDRPAGSMWVVATSFQGRTCFRVLWGRYPSREAARQALDSAPSFFSTPRNHPMVVAIR